jgi:predicted transcriptional regulator of viral defense system
MTDLAKQIVALARKASIIRPDDLERAGIPREHLSRMTKAGTLVRIGRGLYALPNAPVTAGRSLAEVAKAAPNGVVCLLSALRFHELTTQGPHQIWLAVENKAWRPKALTWPVTLVYMSGVAFSAGIEVHSIEKIPVRIYNAAKTVADCFKYRNKIGLDVAIEALRDYLRRHRGGADEVWRYAKICRVTRVMQPYLDAMP